MVAIRMPVVTVLALVLQSAAAQDKLPALAGVSMFSEGRNNIVVNWTLDVETKAPDGAFQGRFDYIGKACQFRETPVAGTFRDGRLEFEAPKTSPGCDRFSMKLKEVRAGSREFEGTANAVGPGRNSQAFDITLAVTAKPR